MNIVVDSSVIIAVLFNEPEKELLIEKTRGATLYAPESLQWEIGNAFSSMLKRKRITMQEAAEAFTIFMKLAIVQPRIDIIASLRLSHSMSIYAYDAYFLQCALENDFPLITLDKRLAKIAGQLEIPTFTV